MVAHFLPLVSVALRKYYETIVLIDKKNLQLLSELVSYRSLVETKT